MDRVRFTNYKGKQILIEDFSQLKPGPEFLAWIDKAQALITSQPPNTVVALLDGSGAHYDVEIMTRLKEFVKANSPYIRCSAVVGVEGLLNVALMALSNVRGKVFESFPDRESALEYLAQQ